MDAFKSTGGILVKYGRVYTDRTRQLAEFEKAVNFRLPRDFLKMIGSHCNGGFDGYYRVLLKRGVEVQWHDLLLMKLADQHDPSECDVLKLLAVKPKLFGPIGALEAFPFGKAYRGRLMQDMASGYLAFSPPRNNTVIFISERNNKSYVVASSFRQMMLNSSFVSWG